MITVPAGSFFGLVGPNGAGKTTTLSMAVGLLRPDAGTAKIFGYDMWRDPQQAKSLIGVLPDGVMAVVEQLCDRVAVISSGRVLATGTLTAVTRGSAWRNASSSSSGHPRSRREGYRGWPPDPDEADRAAQQHRR